MGADIESELELLIKKELPRVLKEDPKFRFEIIGILSETFCTKEEIMRMLEEIKALRKDFNARFEEHSKVLEGHSVAIKELTQRIEEHSKVLEGHSHRIDKMDVTLSAIGARWGIMAESAFREGLRGIFEERFGVKVSEWVTEDTEGLVFGHRSIVQVDVAVKNGEHWLVEIKSSTSRGDVSTFKRLGELYYKEKEMKPKLILVTPFIDDKAKRLADKFNIAVYTSL